MLISGDKQKNNNFSNDKDTYKQKKKKNKFNSKSIAQQNKNVLGIKIRHLIFCCISYVTTTAYKHLGINFTKF